MSTPFPASLFSGDRMSHADAARLADDYWTHRHAGDLDAARAALDAIGPTWTEHTTETGATVRSRGMGYQDSERLAARLPEGWRHVEGTPYDALRATFANEERRELASYCEGDVSVTTCPDAATFRAEIDRARAFYAEHA